MSDYDDTGIDDLETGTLVADDFDSPDIDTAGMDELGELHGAPESSSDEWFLQDGDGYCVPASITQVVSEATGRVLPDESVVVSAMQQMGLDFDPSRGMRMDEGVQVLDYLGIDAEVETNLSVADLETYLDEGRSLILGVDSGDIWGEPDPAGTTGDADHALVITAIDQDRGYVVLSDPGSPDGNQEWCHSPILSRRGAEATTRRSSRPNRRMRRPR